MERILIVIDMQNDFITGALGTREAACIVPEVVKEIKNFEGTVVFTRDTHQKDYLLSQEGQNLPVEHCIEGTWGWELQKEIEHLQKKNNNRIFDKNTFGSKELAMYLQEFSSNNKIEEIVLVGLCTDICVISNALTIKAFLPEVKITVNSSCCAGVTPDSHKNALNAMKMCQINVI